MSILLVTYDLLKPGQDYTDLLKTLKGYSWARLSESSYAIDTSKTPKQIYDELKPTIDQNDTLFVITLIQPYFGYGPTDVIEWLRTSL